MSGGVDSSVAAALLKQQGHEVVGVYMKNWSEDDPQTGVCTAEADFADVRSVCQHLGIPYYTFNFEQEYKERVLSYFYDEYAKGRTPNPDVMCNKEVKFDLFLKKALLLGADLIATGHHIRKLDKGGQQYLLKGVDPVKDQTYFVYNLDQEQLRHCLFPIGEYPKSKIRQLAKHYRLPTAEKKDSQGICFIGPVEVREFLKKVIRPKKGKIVNIAGETLGHHDGAWFYTIGQRRIEGLDGQPEPLYVIATDVAKNTVTVGPDSYTYGRGVIVEALHQINPPIREGHYMAKPRYGPDLYPGTLTRAGRGWQFVFDQPQRALTIGQSLVLYDNDICLGGGVIESVLSR